MDADYGARYADLYRRHWWWRARETYLIRILERHLRDAPSGDVLDFGCGDGLFFPVLKRFGEPYGVEPEAALLDPNGLWRSRISTAPLAFDATETARYGLIVALDVLEHLADPATALKELVRRLKPGGVFVATVPAFQPLWTAHDDVNHHVRRYTRLELETLVSEAGLAVEHSRYFFVWLAVLKWIVVRKERFLGAAQEPASVPWGPINAVTHALCRAEQLLLGDSQTPFGSSVLIVARAPA